MQRHKLPDIESVINSLSRLLLFLKIENKDITNPGVQNPHWEPWYFTIASWTGWSFPFRDTKSSTIISCLPFNDGTNEMQELIAL